MTPPIPSTSNVAATSAPISKEETALLADEQHVQQETDNLKRLLAAKCQQCEELAKKQKAAQMECKEETKVRARMLVEAVVAEVRQAAKHANKCTKDAAWKAMEELQRLQSLAKGKHQLVHHMFTSSGGGTEESIGKCYNYAGEGESHASKVEGFIGSREEWRDETEGE